ncbi:hypothetical protein GCM10010121_024720 [Streptomyces brasiliensis]|uniref:Uncharacterized protein n=1 Tax=Streptomyces brasiliensis TaxID=1954 RepID=A0A917KKG8_9ACTN|nr:hypothetical protein GCM10010121_024720 [Streptomyces brasiliensis]
MHDAPQPSRAAPDARARISMRDPKDKKNNPGKKVRHTTLRHRRRANIPVFHQSWLRVVTEK